ncbi:MAG: NAD(P)-dependent oxidoreductase [Chitinophagaceae bacterium]
MIITVFGATGQVGKRIVRQALAKNYTVRAFGRNVDNLMDEDERNDNLETLQGYVFDEGEVYDAVKNVDAVLSALGGAFDGTDKTRSLGIKNIIAQMTKANVKRIVALGGIGVLNAPDGSYLIDAPNYPAQYKPVGKEHLQAFLYLEQSNLEWTFVCSPDIKNEDATGKFITKENYPPEPNKNFIAAGDLAEFMLQEILQPKYLKKRVGISAI